jgi:hypothetical protein
MRQVKAQIVGILVYFILVAVVLILLAFGLGAFLNTWGQAAIVNGGLTGFEAFAWGNLNLWIIFCMVIGLVAMAYIGSRQ